VMSMSGVWLSEPTMPEKSDWSVEISGIPRSVESTMHSLTILAYQDSNDEEYANIFEVSGSGLLLSDINPYYVTTITIDGYLYFISGKKVYGIYRLTIGGNPEDGTFSGTLNLTSGSIKFVMTSSNGNKYTLTGQKKP